ncbi:MAG: rhodanese-like domain-containing protein [Succinivibrio sp.]
MAEQSFTIHPGITQIDYPTARALIDSGKCVLIDVREKEEYNAGFIPPAVNLSVNDITKETASKIAPDLAKPVVIYCRSGRRTKDAAKKLLSLGYYYILDMGGISNWPYSVVFP